VNLTFLPRNIIIIEGIRKKNKTIKVQNHFYFDHIKYNIKYSNIKPLMIIRMHKHKKTCAVRIVIYVIYGYYLFHTRRTGSSKCVDLFSSFTIYIQSRRNEKNQHFNKMIFILSLVIVLISCSLSAEINSHILIIAPPMLSHIIREYF